LRDVPSARKPGQRTGLTRGAVLAAARDVLTDGGYDGLSMRAVARRLDVAPNALYSYVIGKQALIDLLLDDVLAGVDERAAVGDPTAALHALMTGTYDILLEHADLLPAFIARQGARGPHAQRLGDSVHAQLHAAGVRGRCAEQAQHILIIHTIGFAAFASHPNIGIDGQPGRSASQMRSDFTTSLKWLINGLLEQDEP